MTLPKNNQGRKQERRKVALVNLWKNAKEDSPPEYKKAVSQRILHLEAVIKDSSSGAVRTKKKREDKRKK